MGVSLISRLLTGKVSASGFVKAPQNTNYLANVNRGVASIPYERSPESRDEIHGQKAYYLC